MFSGNQISTYINIGIIAFFALAILIESLFGLKRGWKRQLLHTCFSLVGLTCAFFITKYITSVKIDEQTVSDAIATLEGYGLAFNEDIRSLLLAVDPELYEVVISLPLSTVIAPLLFTLTYTVINLVLKLISLIVKIFVPKARSKAQRLIGLGIGFAEGALISSLLLLPIAATTSLLDETVAATDSSESPVAESVHAVYDEYISPISKNPILGITEFLGGEFIMNRLATVEIEGEKMNMRDEVVGAVKIVIGSEIITELDWDALTSSDKENLTSYVNSVSSSAFLTHTFSGAFKTFANYAEEQGNILILDDSDGELLHAIFKDSVAILGTSTRDTVGSDLKIIKEMFFILSDGRVIKAFDNFKDSTDGAEKMIDVLNGDYGDGTVLTALISTLRQSERTAPLVKTLSKLSLTVIDGKMDVGENADVLYDSVISGLDEINSINPENYTDSEYSNAVEEVIGNTLEQNGITVDGEILKDITEYAVELRAEDGNINEEDIQDVFVKYFESYKNNMTPTP